MAGELHPWTWQRVSTSNSIQPPHEPVLFFVGCDVQTCSIGVFCVFQHSAVFGRCPYLHLSARQAASFASTQACEQGQRGHAG